MKYEVHGCIDFGVFNELSAALQAVTSGDDKFQYVSKNWSDVLGYTFEELVSMSFLDLIHPEDKDRTFKEILRINREKKSNNFINRYKKKDGSYIWLSWNCVRTNDGLVYGSAIDVTHVFELKLNVTPDLPLSDSLTPIELEIFDYLKNKSPKSVSKKALIEAVYTDREVNPMTINVHISNLRTKLITFKYDIEAKGKGRWALKQLS